MTNCEFVKKNNSKCKAYAVHDSKLCFWHSEETKEDRSQAQRTGGLSSRINNEVVENISIKCTGEILKLIEQTINDLRSNKLSTKNANAIGYLAGIALKTVEQNDFEKRLEVLEYAYKIKKTA